MDHDTSIKTMAAERYLLEELSSSERDEFELHFFECPECAESVRSGFQFGESAKNAGNLRGPLRAVFGRLGRPGRWSKALRTRQRARGSRDDWKIGRHQALISIR